MESVAKIEYMNNYYLPLLPGEYYHIFNRGNNRNNLFYKKGNYEYFLRKYDEYLSDYIDTYAFCLLPNHFHLLIRVKESDEISKVVSCQFRRFFISFSQAINKQENRVGSLFQKNFKRKKVDSEKYFLRLVYYIHANPQIHGLIDNFKLYPWSSYERILSKKLSKLKKNEILKWFGTQKEYLAFHEQLNEFKFGEDLFLE
jgi:REP element-mobilizing transposase RayT